ncbi:MAG: hypothetical protein ACQKBT_01840, partial [Puniceicoccales bacterium]
MTKPTLLYFSIAACSLSSAQADSVVLEDSFDYTNNSELAAGGWTYGGTTGGAASPSYQTTDGGTNNIIVLNNRYISKDFDTTLTEDFSVSIDIQHNTAGRQQWVLISSAPDVDGNIYGYSFAWASNATESVYVSKYVGKINESGYL